MKYFSRITKLFVLTAGLPFVYGCGSGAGVGSLVGFLFGSGGLGGGEIALLGSSAGSAASGVLSGGANVASLVNPEPASMLLLGSGLIAISYFTSKNRPQK
jgi:hypothetical protein